MQAKLVQLAHIAKSQLKMDDDSYRLLLQTQFNQGSSKQLTEAQLRQLIQIFQQKGATVRLPFGRSGHAELSRIAKKLWAQWKAMADKGIVVESSSRALDAYVARMFPDKLWHKLTATETAQVIESLKQWQKRVEG